MKHALDALLRKTLAAQAGELFPRDAVPAGPLLERTRDRKHGDFATNVALALAKSAGKKPRDLAEEIIRALPASPLFAKAEIAGPGFINFFLAPAAYHTEVGTILDTGERYGTNASGKQAR